MDARQQDLVDDFALFSDWSERYQHLIELGRTLPTYPESKRTPEHLVSGCQSQVWLDIDGDAQSLDIRAASDAAIVSGLLALIVRVYNGRSAQEVVSLEPEFIEAMGLSGHLSMTRRNGLGAVIARVKQHAAIVAAAQSV